MKKNIFNPHDKVKIHYEITQGKKGKPTLVFLHGLGGNIRSWDTEIKIFSQLGYTTLAIDLRGHGYSGRPKEEKAYELMHFVKDIRAVYKEEKIRSSILIGHCLGGMIALFLQAIYPSSARALILVDSGFYAPYIGKYHVTSRLIRKMLYVLGKYAPKVHFAGHVSASKYKGTGEYNLFRVLSDVTHVSLSSYFLICSHITTFDGSHLLKKIKVPTLIIQGDKDTVFPPQMAKDLKARIKNSTIDFIPNATHILVINQPTSVAASIDRFIINCGF